MATLGETKKIQQIFYATDLKKRVPHGYNLRRNTDTHEASLRRALLKPERDRLINRISYRPDDYPGYGTLPLACGIAYDGVAWARENCPATDPKELVKDHSTLTLEHEIKRARFHMKVSELCDNQRAQLFWKKTDLNHTVKPDDAFAIKKDGKITYYFFELENKRKSFRGLSVP